MALAGVPPWLVPPNFLGASEAGAQMGLGIRRQAEAETEAADRLRLAYDQLASQEQRANEQARATMALRAQQLSAMEAYHRDQLAQRAETEKRQRENMDRLAEQFQAGQELAREKMKLAATPKQYGEPTFIDVPDVPGAKYAYRAGSPGGHLIAPPRPTGLTPAQRASLLQKVPRMMTEIADLEPGTPQRIAAENALGETQKLLTNAPPPIVLRGTNAPAAKAPYPDGTILRKKDGSKWIVHQGQPVPWAEASMETQHTEEPSAADDLLDEEP